MNKVLFYVIISMMAISCSENVKYQDIASHPNYYDSLYDGEILQKIIEIDLSDSVFNSLKKQGNNNYWDSLILNNSYVRNGIRNINIYNELEKAYKLDKPVLIYFNSIACVNCRKMETQILNDEKINRIIDSNFHFIVLNVDIRTKIPENNWIKEPRKTKTITTISGINTLTQRILQQSGSQPKFVALDHNNFLGDFQFTNSKEKFSDFLKKLRK